MIMEPRVLIRAALILTSGSLLSLAACLNDQKDDDRSLEHSRGATSQPASSSIFSPTPKPTPTPDTSLEPTVGMLATVPIGRMSMECWKKEGKIDGQSFLTASCEAIDSQRELYLEAWTQPEPTSIDITVSFIYIEIADQGKAICIECKDLRIIEPTYEELLKKERGDLLPGTCNKFLHSYEEASRKFQTMSRKWTAHSGLEEAMHRDEMQAILEVLKQ